jgi:hypothetical protein
MTLNSKLTEQTSLLDNVSGYLNQLSEYYNQEVFNMYTKEDYMRDYPPPAHAPFVFPWEKEYHDQELQKAAEAAKEATEKAAEAAKEATEKALIESKIETARIMVSKGLETSLICEITGLSEDEVLKLASEG